MPLAATAIFVVALVFRLGVILRKGGIHGIIGYDIGVYFGGADALLHGRLPYRDFTMVHPPGITLALLPFAALTRVMTDWHAVIVAAFAFCVLGAVNAVLVMRVCQRLGIARRGAIIGGLFYAVWFGTIISEFEIKLEPLCNFFLLLGLLALLRDQRRPQRWSAVLGGAVIGLTIAVKIWWVVPIVLILAWHGYARRSARAGFEALLGAAASVTAVCLPFFLVDPSGMWQSVVTGQLGRTRTTPILHRLAVMTTVPDLVHRLTGPEFDLLAVAFVVALCVAVAMAWRGSRRARFLSVVTIAQIAVLIEAPSWFPYYCDYLAVGLAVIVGAAVVAVRREHLVRAPAAICTAAALLLTCLITVAGTEAIPAYAGAGQLTRTVSDQRCVLSNTTTVLLRLDALSRDLSAGCPNWIDISGRLMGPDSEPVLKAQHQTWTSAELRYLRSAGAVVIWPDNKHYMAKVRRGLAKDGKIAIIDGTIVYRG